MKYIKLFNNHSKYEEFLESEEYVTPYAVWCNSENEGHLHKFVETRVVAKFNVTDASEAIYIMGQETGVTDYFTEVEIDGVKMNEINSTYEFETTGEHIVKYTLADPTEIGDNCFNGCNKLVEVTLPESVETIGDNCFNGCNKLVEVTLPESIETIGDAVFAKCDELTSIEIPENVSEIGDNVFEVCNLVSIRVNKNNTTFDSRNNCNAIISTEDNVLLYGCSNTVIPNDIEEINAYAFYGCTGLTDFGKINTLTSIGDDAFNGCTGLTSIELPEGITEIGTMAFNDCSSLESIKCEATTPPTLGSNAFDGTNNCPIYVPNNVVDTYKSANGWSTYASRIEGYAVFEYVDMGLPSGTLWAKCNLGASTETETGLYYQWADTQGYTAAQVGINLGQKYFGLDDYKYYNAQSDDVTKYNTNDNKTVLDLTDDAAYVAIGNDWQIPHTNAVMELIQNSTLSLATRDNVDGVLLTSNVNGNTLFFPWSYNVGQGQIHNVENFSELWVSMLDRIGYIKAFVCSFYDSGSSAEFEGNSVKRSTGCVIRPVKYNENYVWPNP